MVNNENKKDLIDGEQAGRSAFIFNGFLWRQGGIRAKLFRP